MRGSEEELRLLRLGQRAPFGLFPAVPAHPRAEHSTRLLQGEIGKRRGSTFPLDSDGAPAKSTRPRHIQHVAPFQRPPRHRRGRRTHATPCLCVGIAGTHYKRTSSALPVVARCSALTLGHLHALFMLLASPHVVCLQCTASFWRGCCANAPVQVNLQAACLHFARGSCQLRLARAARTPLPPRFRPCQPSTMQPTRLLPTRLGRLPRQETGRRRDSCSQRHDQTLAQSGPVQHERRGMQQAKACCISSKRQNRRLKEGRHTPPTNAESVEFVFPFSMSALCCLCVVCTCGV